MAAYTWIRNHTSHWISTLRDSLLNLNTGIVSAESHLLPCTKSERASLPPRFTGYSKKAPMEQSEEAELSSSNIQVAHEVDIKGSSLFVMPVFVTIIVNDHFFVENLPHLWTETKHHDCPSWSPETNSETEAVSFSQAFLELQTMVLNTCLYYSFLFLTHMFWDSSYYSTVTEYRQKQGLLVLFGNFHNVSARTRKSWQEIDISFCFC